VRLVVGVLTVALASGGTPARAVDGVASTLRERAEVDRELQALATQARTSAVVVTLAPLAFGLLGVLGDQRTAAFLLRTPTGLVCLTVGVVLDGFGAWWMTRIAASAS
jgi:tight adherence protein B